MADGPIVAEGPPIDVVTADLVEKVFGLACVIVADPEPAHGGSRLTGVPDTGPRR